MAGLRLGASPSRTWAEPAPKGCARLQLWRKVSMLLGMLAWMDGFLSSQGRAGLTPRDRELLAPRFERLHRDATSVATLSRDLISELART